jgi:hypothetical protein
MDAVERVAAGTEEHVWSAIARVDADDACYVHEESEGQLTGISVECVIVDGPLVGARVNARIASPIGGWQSTPVKRGDHLLLALTHGSLNGPIIAAGKLPGGLEQPLPKAVAGVATSAETMGKEEIHAPGKGVNVRWYVQGAAFLIRLKGAIDGFAGEFYLEADDQKTSPDGKNGTFFRLVRDAADGVFGLKLRSALGAFLQVKGQAVVIQSPNGLYRIEVNDDGVWLVGDGTAISLTKLIAIDGPTLINMPKGLPPTPVNAAIYGVSGVAGVPSLTTYIGP